MPSRPGWNTACTLLCGVLLMLLPLLPPAMADGMAVADEPATNVLPFTAAIGDVTLHGYQVEPRQAEAALDIVVVLHGWLYPGTEGAGTTLADAIALARRGLTSIAISMRGWPATGGVDDCGYQQSIDIERLIALLRDRHGSRLRSIGIMGFSQGGQVALLAASRKASPDYVVAWYPVTDIDNWQQRSNISGITDDYIPNECSRPPGRTARSPVHHADRIDSPVMLIHADDDRRVPTEQSVMMAQQLLAAGKAVELEITHGGGHGDFDPAQEQELMDNAIEFIRRHITSATMVVDPGSIKS